MIYFIIIDPILILNLIVYLSYLELFFVSLLIMIKLTEILRCVILFINAQSLESIVSFSCFKLVRAWHIYIDS